MQSKNISKLSDRVIEILDRLISMDTTSRNSNLALIEWVVSYLEQHNVAARLIRSPDGMKANLLASIGPMAEGGVVLSGHTDVVPVDDQKWTSNPFTLIRRDDRLFGRGTADMKAFIACALAAVPLFQKRGLFAPIHLALSYDEEVGCQGVASLIEYIKQNVPDPKSVIVGEPTMMRVIGAHKGIAVYETVVTGHEAHSSLTHLGISANHIAIELMRCLMAIGNDLKMGVTGSPFNPAHSTITIGLINGGTASNILSGCCRFLFDIRYIPADDPKSILSPFYALIERLQIEAESFPSVSIKVVELASSAPLNLENDSDAEALVRGLTGDNQPSGAVPYCAEAGQFQQAGFSTVLCGPGSIKQAHQPDEYIDMDQIEQCASFMLNLSEKLSKDIKG